MTRRLWDNTPAPSFENYVRGCSVLGAALHFLLEGMGLMGRDGMGWAEMSQNETEWDEVGQDGTGWDRMGRDETEWGGMRWNGERNEERC